MQIKGWLVAGLIWCGLSGCATTSTTGPSVCQRDVDEYGYRLGDRTLRVQTYQDMVEYRECRFQHYLWEGYSQDKAKELARRDASGR